MKISGQQGTYSGRATYFTFLVEVVDDCPTATLTASSVLDQSYYVNTSPMAVSIGDFSSSVSSSICGAFTYSATKSDDSALDSFFTF